MNDIFKLGEKVREERQTKNEKRERFKKEEQKTKVLQTISSLKDLRRKINPTGFIPYRSILGEKGFLSDGMKVVISKRKREMLDEMSNILAIEKKFGVEL